MPTIDLRREFKHLYSAKAKPEMIDVPEGKFLAYSGRGEPGGAAYSEALESLYGVAYTLKFALKKTGKTDFTVPALEGQWWWDDERAFTLRDAPPRETWNWRSLIRMPDFVTVERIEETKKEAARKKGPAAGNVKLESIHEGLCAQIMHTGPYSEEDRTVEILNKFIEEQGYRLRGRHHEIYLSDPRRTAPEKMKTIIRHPVEK